MGTKPLKFLNINIEQDKHLPLVVKLIKEREPDVVCLEEVFLDDLQYFERTLNMRSLFGQMCRYAGRDGKDPHPKKEGVAILSRVGFLDSSAYHYGGSGLPDNIYLHPDQSISTRVFLGATVEVAGIPYTIGVTHFRWTPHGEADDGQRAEVKELLKVLSRAEEKEIIFSGDFNAPRGGEIFSLLAGEYKDNLPPHIKTTLDPLFHRAPKEEQADKAVDTIFSTPQYDVRNVEVISGVSDHCALFAEVSKLM